MKMFSKYLNDEILIYEKIYKLNEKILEILNIEDENLENLSDVMRKRESLIEELKSCEEKLNELWNNWNKYSKLVDIEKVKQLKNILKKNTEIEKRIIEQYTSRLNEIKSKLIKFSKGKNALNGYKVVKVNIPLIKSFKI